ncbi:hypothetical protein BLD44_018285 [Mastigocladus laminosus UU774]|nr:hypothetical protein BLD44_018285 [Mastigocladus laminosus UU774]
MNMTTVIVRKKLFLVIAGVVLVTLLTLMKGQGKIPTPKLAASFSSFYSVNDLGTIPKLPPAYGGLTFDPKNAKRLLIGGLAGTQKAQIYEVRVKRGSDNHIIGFNSASPLAKAPGKGKGGIDASLAYSPKGDVLFYTSYDDNSIGQIKLGSRSPNKQINLTALGIASSTGALAFVPKGFVGVDRLKITSYTTNKLYDTTITPDGSGTYNIVSPSRSIKLSGGLDAMIFVKAGKPGFVKDSLLIAEFDTNNVSAYQLDTKGNPIPSSRQNFITGISYHSPTSLTGTIGATTDPLTGDFLYSTVLENTAAKGRIFAVRSSAKSSLFPTRLR